MAKARRTSARASAAAVASATAAPAEGQTSAPAVQAEVATATTQDTATGVSASGAVSNTDPATTTPPTETPGGDTVSAEDQAAHAAMAAQVATTDAGPADQSADDVLGAVDPAEAWTDPRQGDDARPDTLGRRAEVSGAVHVGEGFRLRLTSGRAPYTRGRIRFTSKREPVILDEIGLDQFRALIADPAITLHVENVATGKLVLVPSDALDLTRDSEGFAAFARALDEAERADA